MDDSAELQAAIALSLEAPRADNDFNMAAQGDSLDIMGAGASGPSDQMTDQNIS